jgi:N4-gp56 family major capsid protein
MYIGSELLPTLKAMKDLHNNPAFIEIQKYAGNTTPLKGEVGSVDNFRVVVVPKMLKWANAGAIATDSDFYAGDTRYDVFPMLCVGDKSFTTIGFQTDGKTVKFKTIMRKPGEATADKDDPFGKKGFASIQWWYGFLAMRPERILLIKTVAKM